VIEQKEQVIEQKEQTIELKNQVINQMVEQHKTFMEKMVLILAQQGKSAEEIAEQLPIPLSDINNIIHK
ncbi:MAG: hypothetical protein RR382_01285, partial [Tannerellaceae bacterium]